MIADSQPKAWQVLQGGRHSAFPQRRSRPLRLLVPLHYRVSAELVSYFLCGGGEVWVRVCVCVCVYVCV